MAHAKSHAHSRKSASKTPRASGPKGVAALKASFERYTAMAHAAIAAGDSVESENCYQHAEHYFRLLKAKTA